MADIFIKIGSILLTHLVHKVGSSGLLPDLCHRLTQIGILISLKMYIFLQGLFQLSQLVIHAANTQWRRKIADKAGSTAALGLYALAGINNPVGINIRQITGTDIGIALFSHRHALTRKPFQTAMRTDMHHRICAPDIAQPVIKTYIMMRRRTVGRMINFIRILAKATRWLHRNKNIAIHRSGNQQKIIIKENLARCFAPILLQALLYLFRQRLIIIAVCTDEELGIGIINLLFAHIVPVIRRTGNQLVNKLLPVCRNMVNDITCIPQILQQQAHAFNTIYRRTAANVGIGRRMVVKNNGYFLFGIRLNTQQRQLFRLPHQHIHALCNLLRNLLALSITLHRRHRAAMDNTIKLRQTHTVRHLYGTHAVKVFIPFLI